MAERASQQVAATESSGDDTFRRAQELVANAQHVLITGRICSVQTARSAVRLAQKIGATIDCAEDGILFRNIEAIQRAGANTISIAEARDITNAFVVIGDDRLLAAFPKLPESLHRDAQSPLQSTGNQTVILIGHWSEAALIAWRAAGFSAWTIPCAIESIPTALAQTTRMKTDSQSDLVQTLLTSRYTTVVWSAAFLDGEYPDLWCERLWQWIASRNESSRCSGLALSNFDGTFQQTCTWLTGFPGRVLFDGDYAAYDVNRNSYRTWLKQHSNEATCASSVVICIDESASDTPFSLDCQSINTVHICSSNTAFVNASHSRVVSLPAAVAGLDSASDMFRADQSILVRVGPACAERMGAPKSQSGVSPSASLWLDRLCEAC